MQDRLREQGAYVVEQILQKEACVNTTNETRTGDNRETTNPPTNRYFFVCGDGSRMAKGVQECFKQLLAVEGGLGEEKASAYVSGMIKTGRYVQDIWS